jgi:hypothetical protein
MNSVIKKLEIAANVAILIVSVLLWWSSSST